MKVVIDIPEEEYNKIKENDCGLFNGRIYQMIRNGISLPEEQYILNKISAEIMAKSYQSCDDYFSCRIIDVSCVLEIINKYKAESEEENANSN